MVVLAWKAEHDTVARRRGTVDGEAVARGAGEGGADRPAGVVVLVQPAQPQRQCQLARAAERQLARQLRADGRAQRVGALLRDIEAERVGARFGEGVLRDALHGHAGEWRQAGLRGSGPVTPWPSKPALPAPTAWPTSRRMTA